MYEVCSSSYRTTNECLALELLLKGHLYLSGIQCRERANCRRSRLRVIAAALLAIYGYFINNKSVIFSAQQIM